MNTGAFVRQGQEKKLVKIKADEVGMNEWILNLENPLSETTTKTPAWSDRKSVV